MLWYGLKNLKWENNIYNLKLRKKLKMRTLCLNFSNKITINKHNFFFYLPPNWNSLIFKYNYSNFYLLSFLFSENYFFYLPLNLKFSKFYYDKHVKVFNFNILFINNFFNFYWKYFKNVFFSFSKIFFKKLKFKGKGYYIYKTIRNTVALQFNYSHMNRVFGYFISLKFISKTIIFMYGLNNVDIFKIGKKILLKRPHNIFTGKGVRFSKQIIYKKTGKISSYR